ncbi:MAG: hypothetical protein CO156_01610 [Candidatus Pacebacteria bacterium CG_4_9_14_3_um_filter_40_12]|nr:MAG: hypothetical protein COU64_04460 [Candidatus Pacebacteria bacterium CG10_big_fil_rev_8_21_14_0_10_40_26]PIZ79559.1 MAG: hypothetical protein COY01_00360 [Candidatus Pacebacteria bacterium CG_4_10_14_0_2_um_filter_40_20]PJA69012.1 MAG: hypothetical protein CO156_01610 [Candidatus Pacebacteria bacterium CG_4_9_14_3_um_filter_40_12]PJC41855.1 MAG: hypothetical protein CO041_03995 [Candidatus Pacebacteria bacterium CG_4_9_14_0_2_um_filter_40_15]
MTWVIGIPTMFGYGVLISDVQATVSFPDGKEDFHDVVQKIYPVGEFAMSGFSGDIETGFMFTQALRDFMSSRSKGGWIPDQLAREWGKRAKELYSKLPEEKKRPFSMIIVAVDPIADNGSKGQPKSFVAKLKAPSFEYEASRVHSPLSIGSGNNKQVYLDDLERIHSEPEKLMQMEVGNQFGYAQVLGVVLSYDVFRNPHPGVSKHLQIALVTKNGFQINPLNFNADIGLPHEQKIEMPELVKNWRDFDRKMKKIYKDDKYSWADAIAKG